MPQDAGYTEARLAGEADPLLAVRAGAGEPWRTLRLPSEPGPQDFLESDPASRDRRLAGTEMSPIGGS